MATHFVCQSTEPLPHVYQTGLSNLSHGAVSQYEILNDSNKKHTQFPPPGWDFSQTSEEDSLPLVQSIPIPEWKNTSFHPDPELCITPQKPSQKAPLHKHSKASTAIPHKKPDIDPDPMLTLTPERPQQVSKYGLHKENTQNGKKHRVRFDVEEDAAKWEDEEDSVTANNLQSQAPHKVSPEKVYQPELYGDDDDGFDFGNKVADTVHDNAENSKTLRYTVGKVNSQSVYIPLTKHVIQEDSVLESNEPSQLNNIKTTQHRKNGITQTSGASLPVVKVVREKSKSQEKSQSKIDKDPIASSVVPEQNVPKRKVKVLRESQYTPDNAEYTYPFGQTPLDYAGGEEHMFARPEYNSTLRMKMEAEKLKNSTIDIERALQKKLNVSEATKTSIHEKAAAQVNNPDSKTFTGLVSLDVPVEELCKQVADHKTTRAKQVKVSKKKLKDQKEPDLLDFFSDDRQKESITFSLPGISAPAEKLSTVPNRRAFDLYKHTRVWERNAYKK